MTEDDLLSPPSSYSAMAIILAGRRIADALDRLTKAISEANGVAKVDPKKYEIF